jgi:hypothetical protein
MQITCEKCGAAILAANLDLQRNLAKCEACNHIFNCQAQLNALGSSTPESRRRDDVPMPKGIRVFRRANGLRITRQWFGAKAIGLLVFCCFWDGFMIVWFSIAITRKLWPMAAFGTIHALVGVGLTYAAVAMLLNTTTITAQHGTLQVTHGPLPAPGTLRLPTDRLAQLYTMRHVSHTRNGTSIAYELRAKVRDGTDVKLIGGLEKPEQAVYIEQQIESFLGIVDHPVQGEDRT